MELNFRRFLVDLYEVTKRLRYLLAIYAVLAAWVATSSWAQAWICASITMAQTPSSKVVTLLDTGSMAPTLDTKDVIIIAPVQAQDLQIGDIVSYRLPERIAKLAGVETCMHRIVGRTDGGFITKGDANAEPDFWIVTPDLIRGRVVASYRI